MLTIIYGCLPASMVTEIGGLCNITNHSYSGVDVLKVKYIGTFPEMNLIVFSALVDRESGLFPSISISLSNIIISPTRQQISNLNWNSYSSLTDNAKRKVCRKQNNRFLTIKNWKQFIARKSSILNYYSKIL